MSGIKTLVLDFDGVVIESAGIKKEAYRQMFEEEFPQNLAAILEYQERSGGVTRRLQFEEIFEQILRETPPKGRIDELERRYVSLMLSRVVAAPFVPGAREFLEESRGRREVFVASATPEDELRQIVRDRGVEELFRDVYGSPMTKIEILGMISRRTGSAPGEMAFVGDFPTDRDAAEAAGVHFIARLGSAEEMEESPIRIRDLTELSAALEGISDS